MQAIANIGAVNRNSREASNGSLNDSSSCA